MSAMRFGMTLCAAFILVGCGDDEEIRLPGVVGASTQTFDVGPGPNAVTTGHLNPLIDLFVDFLTANSDGSLSLMSSNGNGIFTRTDVVVVGVALTDAVISDTDANFNPDIVVTHGDSITILVGDGSGNFVPGAPIGLGVGTAPSSLVVTDVNADGFVDIVTTLSGTAQVAVLLNDIGNPGTFLAPIPLAVGNNPSDVVIADFNTDGAPDIATTNTNDNTISVILQNPLALGTFFGQTPFATGISPVSLAFADFDQINGPDIAVVNNVSGTVSILLNNGAAVFAPAAPGPAGTSPTAIAALDWNGDTSQDYFVTNSADDNGMLAYNDLTPAFPTTKNFAAGDGPVALAVNFFNADPIPDVVTANQNDNTATLILSPVAP